MLYTFNNLFVYVEALFSARRCWFIMMPVRQVLRLSVSVAQNCFGIAKVLWVTNSSQHCCSCSTLHPPCSFVYYPVQSVSSKQDGGLGKGQKMSSDHTLKVKQFTSESFLVALCLHTLNSVTDFQGAVLQPLVASIFTCLPYPRVRKRAWEAH